MAKRTVHVTEKKDQRAIPAGTRKLSKALQHKFHTINIAEQEGELPYVDVFVSGTVKNKKNEDAPFARNFQIQRGIDVINVPAMVVHVLMDTAVQTLYRQQERPGKDGTKRNVWIPYKRRSFPCTIVESYDVKKDASEQEDFMEENAEAKEDILFED